LLDRANYISALFLEQSDICRSAKAEEDISEEPLGPQS